MKRNYKLARIALAALGLTSATVVTAQEPNPYYIGVSQAFTRESNLTRAPDGSPATRETISTTSLLAGVNQPIGRQRFYVDGAARHSRYDELSQLNHTGHDFLIGLDWETIERLSGTLSYLNNRRLAPFGVDGLTALGGPTLAKDLETKQELLARARLGLVSLYSLEGSVLHRRLEYSVPTSNFKELEQTTGSLGLLYRPSGLLTLGVAVRHTEGEYPFAVQPLVGPPQADEFDRNDLDLTAVWVPSGLSTLSARLSYSKEDHDAVGARDFSGVTGALSWVYRPTGKTTFTTALSRDTGAQSSFDRIGGELVTSTGSTNHVSDSLFVRALWEATAKISADVSARYIRRKLVNTVTLVTGASSTASGNDETAVLGIGARYAPTRNWLLGCRFEHEKREASSTVSYPYSANVATCSAQFKLQ